MSRPRRVAVTVLVTLAAAGAVAIALQPGASGAKSAGQPTYVRDVKPILDGGVRAAITSAASRRSASPPTRRRVRTGSRSPTP